MISQVVVIRLMIMKSNIFFIISRHEKYIFVPGKEN
jgi:hypothetical protein